MKNQAIIPQIFIDINMNLINIYDIKYYIKQNKLLLSFEFVLLVLSILLLLKANKIFSIYQAVIVLFLMFLFVYDITYRIIYYLKLRKIVILIQKDLTVDNIQELKKVLELQTFFIGEPYYNCYTNNRSISGEVMEFISLTIRLLILNIYIKEKNKNMENIYKNFIEIKLLLEKSKEWKWHNNEKLKDITINNLRFNNKLLLCYLIEYKYSNDYAKKMIITLIESKYIDYDYLKEEGMNEEDINYCLKRIK